MSDVSKFQIGDTEINVKDATARTAASSAVSTANSAMSAVQAITALGRLSVSYNSGTETITFTENTHATN